MLKSIILIWGNPRQGKSSLSQELRITHSYDILSVDELYFSFIRDTFPNLYFPLLNQFISPPYDFIFNSADTFPGTDQKYADYFLGVDAYAAWYLYLVSEIQQLTKTAERLAVEGYLLKDCYTALADDLRQLFAAEVLTLRVDGGQCVIESSRNAPPIELASMGVPLILSNSFRSSTVPGLWNIHFG